MGQSEIDVIIQEFEKALEKAMGDKESLQQAGKDTRRLQQEIIENTKALRSMQSQGIANRQHAEVRGNIERRIEARDKHSMRMPNIANINHIIHLYVGGCCLKILIVRIIQIPSQQFCIFLDLTVSFLYPFFPNRSGNRSFLKPFTALSWV